MNGETKCFQELLDNVLVKCVEYIRAYISDESVHNTVFNIGEYVIRSNPNIYSILGAHTFGNWNIYISNTLVCSFSSGKHGWNTSYKSKIFDRELLEDVLNKIGVNKFEDRIEKFIMLIGAIEHYKIAVKKIYDEEDYFWNSSTHVAEHHDSGVINLPFRGAHTVYYQDKSDLRKKALDKYRNLFVKNKSNKD